MRRTFLSVIHGQRRGPGASLLRGLLTVASWVYVFLHATRRLLYKLGLLRSTKFPCPVVSVGNLTAGGTGKTPLVEYLARWFGRKSYRVAVLARGYGRSAGAASDDEDLLSEMALENVVRLAGADRVASGRRALADYRAELLILDDGFQHYRVRRSLDVVAVDATCPFSNGRRFPRGLLREAPEALKRADLVVLTRVDQADPKALEELRVKVGPAVETVHKPVLLRGLANRKTYPLEWLRGRTVLGFCGTGNPEAFQRTLESLGAQVAAFRAFPDHHAYTAQDGRRLDAEAQEFMAEVLVTTEKDATKLKADAFTTPLLAVRVEIEVVRNEELLEDRLLEVVRDIPRAAGVPVRR
jgi:tetraacyldisaccharide 4'-kinase